MVDLHSHILFQADDGPATFEESLMMLEQAMKQGITQLISTSHAHKGALNVSKEDVFDKLALLRHHIEQQNWDLKVFEGHEITISENTVEHVINHDVLTLANSQYALIELPSGHLPHYTLSTFHGLLEAGYTPVIAHPERQQNIIQDANVLEQFVRSGMLAQLTTGAILGKYGKRVEKAAFELLDRQLIHFIGTDAHDLERRHFDLERAISVLEKRGFADYVALLLENNEAVLRNQPVEVLEPEQPSKKRWWLRR